MKIKAEIIWFAALLLAVSLPGSARTLTQQVDTLVVASDYLSEPMTVTYAVPSAVVAGEDVSYPTVYLLNGYSGDYTDYQRNFNLGEMADRYGMVIVCPDGRDSWYWDSPVAKGMQMESFIVNSLIPRVERDLPVKPGRDSRAIAGLSMGGHGALYLAMRHPDVFGSAGSMSGAVDMTAAKWRNSFKINKWLGDYSTFPKRRRTYSARYQIEHGEPERLNIYIACGNSDPFAGQNGELHKLLEDRGVSHEYVVAPGGHTWDYWRSTLPGIMDFFAQHTK